MDAAGRMRAMINGYQVSQALCVAATLGISDLLADRSRHAADLAAATGAHEPTLVRLLRALECVGVYARNADGFFSNTELGEVLRSDVPGSLMGWASLVGRPYYVQAWAGLEGSVRTGENAFTRVHGSSVWEWRSGHSEEQAIFDRAMTALSGVVAEAVVAAYDFGRFATVVDVGGGRGGLLTAVLSRYPTVRGVLFDRPEVVAAAAPLLERGRVAERCRVVGGDFFDAVPEGADAYLLKAVVHDWPDDKSISLLRTCRRALTGHGTLLLVEQLLGAGPDPARTAFSDLNMLVAPGGQERDEQEYSRLLAAAGFGLRRVVPTGTDVFVLEAEPQ